MAQHDPSNDPTNDPRSTTPGGALAAFSDALADAVAEAGRSIVRVEGRGRLPASGFVWSADGLIVTADHVVERDDDLRVGLPDGTTVPARLVGRDPSSDVAVLKVEAAGLTPIRRAGAARVGSIALLVARPGADLTASLGTVSAVSGPIRTRRGGKLEGLISTDATFYPGFSGGPLVVAQGGAIGLATSRFRGERGSGIVVPLAAIERTVAALSAHGRMRRGFVGIGSQPVQLPPSLRESLGLGDQETGLLVVNVEEGGPAAQAGLLIGDIIVAFAGEPVRDPSELRDLLGPESVGQQVALRIARGGQSQTLTLTVGERA